MSRRSHRAAVLLMLHQQAMGGGLPPVPPAIFSAACIVLPWYRRAWAWLRDRYLLEGWTE